MLQLTTMEFQSMEDDLIPWYKATAPKELRQKRLEEEVLKYADYFILSFTFFPFPFFLFPFVWGEDDMKGFLN